MYAELSIRPVTLKQFIQLGQPPHNTSALLESARYTKSELPVRLARRIKALQKLPFIVGTNPYIKKVYQLYFDSFELICNFPEITEEKTDEKFADMLAQIVANHSENIPTLAKGFQECKKYMPAQDITSFLDDMINARIGIRLIAEQHISLHNARDPNVIGIIDSQTSPARLIQSCANWVRELCEGHYGSSPEIIIDGQIDTTFTYVPVHLEYIISEVLKNAYRATVEYSSKIKRNHHPQIVATISKGENNIGIRIRDQGGGVAPEDLPSIFDYSFTTVPQDEDSHADVDNILSNVSRRAMQTGLGGPIAGLGYGLPLARIYATFFGGSLNLISLHSYGCDLFLRLNDISKSFGNLRI
ncbi:mitochondrial branched-chain alpha-ketoacid dehydrogenase kinase-domain-containing protein [Gigaspora rosea]|uniref:Protein-serine/threonine kinase n=1 Tax=Gigaspora rosea TaxID=44941 RepID=A0A397V0F2_9GLOM|nr:mitochondrial branched-chain alpha-ketoacid dehydrogenase kinase-domain-containing protein [Gigaspora rosea]